MAKSVIKASKRPVKVSVASAATKTMRALQADFEARGTSLAPSRSDAFGIYALAILLGESDLGALAADALTGGANDKKTDFVYIDTNTKRAFIGQAYLSETWGKSEAGANKASSLTTAVTWLLSSDIKDVPAVLQNKAKDLREAIQEGLVTKVQLIYAHNCFESSNVARELGAVVSGVERLCGPNVNVSAIELGLGQLAKQFEILDKEILVTDEISFEVDRDYYLAEGPGWKAVATRVPGSALHDLRRRYGDDLFSANIRSYLGSLKQKKGNINADIRRTVENQPKNFWAFNNGVTLLTNKISITESGVLTVSGASVINGAQTTGVLGECDRHSLKDVLVPCRFVQCSDEDAVASIIAFNNTQNQVKSFDFRSNDRTQKKLRGEFSSHGIEYVHRRSTVRRPAAGAIHIETVAQGLASFHDRFQMATRQRSEIFESDEAFDTIFPPSILAGHVYLVQCLLDAVDSLKLEFRSRKAQEGLTDKQEDYLAFLEYSTAKQFLVSVLGRVAPQIVGRRVGQLHSWRVRPELLKVNRADCVSAWRDVLSFVLPKVVRYINGPQQKAVRSTEAAKHVAKELEDYLEAVSDELQSRFKAIRKLTTIA